MNITYSRVLSDLICLAISKDKAGNIGTATASFEISWDNWFIPKVNVIIKND